jgi:hypothetical protein
MRPGFIRVPINNVNNEDWAYLSALSERHEFCAEEFRLKTEHYSFAGQHRVRLYTAKKNVHWKIPQGVSVDISQVPPANQPLPRRLPRNK